jgi:GNAT superfamily N-acetyltransferase
LGHKVEQPEIRLFTEADGVHELTALLHRAYARLAAMGLRFVATYQDDAITKRRIEEGECYVAVLDNRLVGTVVLIPHGSFSDCEWYELWRVARFGQFAVEPELQGLGIGSTLLDVIEDRARELGASEIALDTAEPAKHLIDYYSKRGYRFIDYIQWPMTNYRSVIMSKRLGPGSGWCGTLVTEL